MSEGDLKEKAPDGTVPIMISMRELETYELKNGPGLSDTVPFKIFERAEILDQVQKMGFMCPFHGVRKEIERMKIEQVLIVADPEERYGENWLLCLTQGGFDSQFELIQQQEEAKKVENENETPEAEEEEKAEDTTTMYDDKPVIPSEWVSETSQETSTEVELLTIQPKRSKIILKINRPRRDLCNGYKFSDRDSEAAFMECRQHKDPNYELSRVEQDIGLQAMPRVADSCTQTTWYRSINSAQQYEPIKASEDERIKGLSDPRLLEFLVAAVGDIEEALQQNETIDIFTDECSNLIEEDIALGLKSESNIKELRTFTDLEYSKNKVLAAIDWHPRRKGVVAVSAVSKLTFNERLELAEKVENSQLLIWNFSDLIHPQLMLQAPQDAYTFRFNPTQPNIIAAGSFSGQIILWDISEAEKQLERKKYKATASSRALKTEHLDDDDGNKKIPPIKHQAISYIDHSHRRPVSDLAWLPPGIEVNNRGHIVETEDPVTHQFVTVAGDGQVLFWDLRYKDPVYRSASRGKSDKLSNKSGSTEIPFTPVHRVVLNKIDGVGELGIRCAVIEGTRPDTGNPSGLTPSSLFYCTTEDGKMVFADWKPTAVSSNSADTATKSEGLEYVQWTAEDHYRPCVSLQRSPFFRDVLLSVGDSCFNLWKEGIKEPIFSSPSSTAPLTAGRWSPTRPGVLMIGKADGGIDVWDLLDQSHRPAGSVAIAPSAISSMEFWNNKVANTKSQLLAAGDINGNLHILDIPRNLWRPLNNEKALMETSFFAHEILRVDYVRGLTEAVGDSTDGNGGDSRQGLTANRSQMDSSGTDNRSGSAVTNGVQKDDDAFAKLEAAFLEELGLNSTGNEDSNNLGTLDAKDVRVKIEA